MDQFEAGHAAHGVLPSLTEVVRREHVSGGGEAGGGEAGGGCPYIGLNRRDGLLQPMLLWDAGMAHSIARALAQHPGRLIYHVCQLAENAPCPA